MIYNSNRKNKMIDVEAEVNKHRNCKERPKLEKVIQDYKSLALQCANNLALAGKYNLVIRKLQEICDRLPSLNLKNTTKGHAKRTPVKTATITSEENTKISTEWKKRTAKD
jgi:hypothetical protein